MAIYKNDIVDINLETGNIHRSFLSHTIGSGDNSANRFGVRTFRDGVPQDLSGATCQAVFMNAAGVNIALTSYGTISGNEAYVTLPQACYSVEGQFTLAIKLVDDGITVTTRIVDGVVSKTGVTGAVVPTDSVPTYQEILDVYDDMVDATAAANTAIAETFDASKAYPAGKYVIVYGTLYRLTADHAAGVTWANTSKVATTFGAEVNTLKSTFNESVGDFEYIKNTSSTGNLNLDRVISVSGGDVVQIKVCTWDLAIANRTSITIYARASGNTAIGYIPVDVIPSDTYEFTVPTGNFTSIRVQCKANTAAGSGSALIGIKKNTYITTVEKTLRTEISELKEAVGECGIYGEKQINILKYPCYTGGLKNVNGVISVSETSAYRFFVFNTLLFEDPQVTIQTGVGDSSNYPYYAYATDGKDKVLGSFIAKNNSGITYPTTVIQLPTGTKKLYVLFIGSTDQAAYDTVKVIAKDALLDFDSENTELQDYAWVQAKEELAYLGDYDILFTLITDSHVNGYNNNTVTVYEDTFDATKRITELPAIDFMVNLGDIATATTESTRETYIANLLSALGAVANRKLYSLVGNHEKNAKHKTAGSIDHAEELSSADLYNLLTKQEGIVYGADRTYYYKNFDAFHIRFAFLNPYDSIGEGTPGFKTEDQYNFVNQQVFADDGYKVIIFAHTPSMKEDFKEMILNHASRIICFFCGHEHDDITEYLYGSTIPVYRFNSSFRSSSETGTNKLTINIIGIRTSDKTVTMRRIGYNKTNADRTFNYT